MTVRRIIIAVLAVSVLALTGCLVSGTFVFTDVFKMSITNGYSHYYVDVTDDSDWEDAVDNLDKIESIGFEMIMTNPNATDAVLDVYVSDPPSTATLATINEVETNGTLVLDNFKVPAGVSKFKMTYSQSFSYLMNVNKLKSLAEGGAFHVYGITSGSTSFSIDSAIVIITLNASATP
jgi:hypothetical protein